MQFDFLYNYVMAMWLIINKQLKHRTDWFVHQNKPENWQG